MKRVPLLAVILAGQIALAQEPPISMNPDGTYVHDEPFVAEPYRPPSVREHYHDHPIEADEPERNSDTLSLNVPRHVRRGLTASMSVRYRRLEGDAIVRVRLSPGLELLQSNPPAASGPHGELLWFGLEGPMGTLKFKARVDPDVPVGTALLVQVDLYDNSGDTERQTEAIVVR